MEGSTSLNLTKMHESACEYSNEEYVDTTNESGQEARTIQQDDNFMTNSTFQWSSLSSGGDCGSGKRYVSEGFGGSKRR